MEHCYKTNHNSLFRKYARLITWFSNTGIGRDYLGLPKDIALLLPNGYHIQKEERIYQATFFTRPYYSPKLTPALRVVDFFSSYLVSIDEAKRVLVESLGLIKPSITKRFSFTTSTFNPDADPESTSVDGPVQRTGSALTWSDITTGAGTGATPSGATDNCPFLAAHAATNDRWDVNTRGIYLYDTSSIPDGDSISSATHLIDTNATVTDDFTQSICLVQSTPASNTTLANSDYGQVGTTQQASDIAISGITINSNFTHTLNATGLSNILKTGVSKFGITLSGDRSNTMPTWVASDVTQIDTTFSDAGSNKPTLTVIHEAPTGGYVFFSS